VGTPVVVLHESRDIEWSYVRSYASDGWVRKEFVALCQREDLISWAGHDPFVITTSAKADLYLDEAMRRHYDYAQMGQIFPSVEQLPQGIVKVLFPTRTRDGRMLLQQGYFQRDDVHVGCLPYTARDIISQAFKLLNAPYGWGGMYGEQDCSRFLQQVFATVGINLPRNSKTQIAVSPPMAIFSDTAEAREKKGILRRALAGASLLYFKGHIMLYLGMVDDKPYSIHATWAYRENKGQGEVVRVMNKVVVSSLDLGHDSRRGSLLSRLDKIVEISNVPGKGGCGCSSRK
jgi:hypothetical protein